MTNRQLHGHIGGSMAGTKPEYVVTIEFFVYADHDDDALYKVTSTLAHDTRYAWAWKNTHLINKGDVND